MQAEVKGGERNTLTHTHTRTHTHAHTHTRTHTLTHTRTHTHTHTLFYVSPVVFSLRSNVHDVFPAASLMSIKTTKH